MLVCLGFLAVCFSSISYVYAEELVQSGSDTTNARLRVLVLPGQVAEEDTFSIDLEVTDTITGLLVARNKFEVFDRFTLWYMAEDYDLEFSGEAGDSLAAAAIMKGLAAEDAIFVTVQDFSQQGVPPEASSEEESSNLLGWLVEDVLLRIFHRRHSENEDPYADNICTKLKVLLEIIDIETGDLEHSIDLDVIHTGGRLNESLDEALWLLGDIADLELRTYYLLTADVISVDRGKVNLDLGSDVGVMKKDIFEVLEPDRQEDVGDRTITIPGRSVAFITVRDLDVETSRAAILRQWNPINPGYRALAYWENPWAFQMDCYPSFLRGSFIGLRIQHRFKPLHIAGGGLSFRVINARDSRGRRDWGGGIGLFAAWRFARLPGISLAIATGPELDLLFRKDDANNHVNMVLFSVPVALNTEIALSMRTDLIVRAGYRIGGKSGKWTYTNRDEEEVPAVWATDRPGVDIAGGFITIGYRRIIF